MFTPGETRTTQTSPGVGTIALIIVAIVGVMMLVCCGGLGLIGAVVYTRVDKTSTKVASVVRGRARPPMPVTQWSPNVLARMQLTPAYTAALDALAVDKQVLEKLGEPIETADDSELLFQREKTSEWDGEDETIAFRIRGPKGTADVRVVAGALQPPLGGAPGYYGLVSPKSITVVLEDGTEIVVPPPVAKESPE